MKKVNLSEVKEKIKQAVQDANFNIDPDLKKLVQNCLTTEEAPAGQEILKQILQNADIAASEKLAMCQDTGLAVFFVEMGEKVKLEYAGFKSLHDAISQGTSEGYGEGYLRKSVCDPLSRKNTGNNNPVFIHWEVVAGDVFKITFMAKGGGSENMSALKMMPPSAGAKGIEDFVVETVSKAGPNPCPPTVVGVGIGGNFDTSALLAKKALLRKPVGSAHAEPVYAEMEKRILDRINNLGIGPMGLGGRTTSLAVHIVSHPCHIASFPVAVNINCHSHRIVEIDF
ncbi:MAG: fumarate hydratase [Candidatus Aminicenantes bacterium]|nr:fumarate hydratase [Acidobacteriota bacterium]MCG2810468.1 fumarate hydratase [Candidatus Aminicenantes bacterium]